MADESTPSSPTSETPPPRTTGGNWRWEPPSAEELQKLMPGYTIEKILGRGGMGAVYRGVQTNLDRPVAIKILPPGVEKEDPSFAERFKSEARLMARLTNPAVVGVYDFGTNLGGQLYFAMEYVDGSDVSQMIAAQGKLPPEHALAITAHVCDALQAAHELGIVHRDIKPANVLINMKGQVKVADFGLAKVEDPGQHGLTKTGYAMGTPDFVAPEALMLGTAIDGRADLYAVGVMLYQMLTGIIPRGAFKPASVLVPGLDPRFDPIIMKAMQHDREERHQSAAELRRELDVILTVPLVRNDAPVSAAIPVAQVAEAPGQRSAAQRPVAKGPQPRERGTPLPQHQSPSPSGVGAPRSQPKSKTPLFIGLAAAAAIGIGAFVMFGGGEKAKPKGPPAPSSGAKVTQNSGQPPKPAAATAAPPSKPVPSPVSATPSLPASKSSEPQFPPGKWVKLFATESELPAELRDPKNKRRAKWDAGWIQSASPGVQLTLAVPSTLSGNYALRARFRVGGDNVHGLLVRRQAGSNAGLYQLRRDADKLTCSRREGDRYHVVSSGKTVANISTGDEFTLEFAVQGSKLYGRLDSRLVCSGTDVTHPNGVGAFYVNDMAVRDIEVINLDGLSEAEALKILGVDEKGNDLRQPAAVAATAPAPSVSKSPPLPVSGTSEPQFPPGQWVKLFTKFEDLPDDLRNPDSGVKFEDGWILCEIGKPQRIYVVDKLVNYAVRGTIRRERIEYQGKMLMIRAEPRGGNRGYVLGLRAGNLYAGKRREQSIDMDDFWRAAAPEIQVPRVGDEYILEFACVGNKVIGRLGKEFIKVTTDTTRASGPGYFTGGEPVRDIEVINLDGLPEAEALRILGVDEKGNDLRALAAKQEQQMAEQAKAADAMAAIPELKTLHEQFVKLQAERVTAPFEADVAKLNSGYLGGIDREIANEKKAGHLDGVIALEAEKKLIADKQSVPAEDATTTTEALKKLRGIYRTAYAKIAAARAENMKALTDPLDTRLKQIEATLTQQDRIDHAKTVREYREGLGKEGGAGTSARGAANDSAGTPATTTSADESEKLSAKEVVEWALSHQAHVMVEKAGVSSRIQSANQIPTGSFKVLELDFSRAPEPRSEITDAELEKLAGQKDLTILQLQGRKGFNGSFLAKLNGLRSLRYFAAPDSNFTAEHMHLLSEFPALDSMRISAKTLNEGFDKMPSLKRLKTLGIHGAPSLEALASLARLPDLTDLKVINFPLTVAQAEVIAQIKGLTDLEIVFSGESAIFTQLSKLPRLSMLAFSSTSFQIPLLSGLKELPGLQRLRLNAEIVQKDPEALISILTELKKLELVELTTSAAFAAQARTLQTTLQKALPKLKVGVL